MNTPLARRAFLGGIAAAGAIGALGQNVVTAATRRSPARRNAPATRPPGVTAERIVDLADNVFDLAVLGVAPVANIYGSQYLEPILGYLDLDPAVRDDVLAGVNATTGTSLEPNLEAIVAIEPDLLLITEQFTQLFGDDVLDDLAEVAPMTVIPDGPTWQDRSRAVAAAIGLDGAGEERIAAAEAAMAALGERVAEAGVAGSEVSILRFAFEQSMAFIPPSLPCEIATASGLVLPAAVGSLTKEPAFPDYCAQAYISSELLGDFDADLLVLAEAIPGDGDGVISQPTLASGRAVSADAIQRAPYFLWALNSAVAVEQICRDFTAGVGLLA